MNNETASGPAGAPDRRGHHGESRGEPAPLQSRAHFLKNRSWELVVSLNRGACARGGAQHGFNRETQEACAREWGEKEQQILSVAETIEFLRHCHRRAPFLFFNGNTFADVGRQIVAALFADLPTTRRREVVSAVAHYIAGALPWEPMVVLPTRVGMVRLVRLVCLVGNSSPHARGDGPLRRAGPRSFFDPIKICS